jgi:lon-related putative ATP-dependent protease
VSEVPINELRPSCDLSAFNFQTTAEIEPHVGLIGQDRALDALKFGLSIEGKGFNICVSGEPGTGRRTATLEYLESLAKTKTPPDEWCYVNNFIDPHRPRALRFTPGQGRTFAHAMDMMITEARTRIPRTFESDDYVKRRDEITHFVAQHHETVFSELAKRAHDQGFLLQGSPQGFFLVPMAGEKPMDDQAFMSLPQEEQKSILDRREQLMGQLRDVMKQEQGFEATAAERLAELQRTVATNVVDSLVDHLLEQYQSNTEVAQYLLEVRRDMIEHIDDFLRPQESPLPIPMPLAAREATSPLRKYKVNLLVDCADVECAIVEFESNPTPQRLFGRIEKEALFGAVTTDFTMIRPGSLHRANGGYLVVDFDDVLQYPLSWNELKRTIRTGELTIEEMGDRLGFIETKTVRPEPIPWTGKIVAIAREQVYRLLYSLDPDFRELFKVKADFDLHIDWTQEHEQQYAGLIAGQTRREALLPLDKAAVGRIVEEGARLAEDHDKLSIRFGELTDIVREASYWASRDGAPVVTAPHVRKAVDERTYRVNLIEEHVRDSVARGIIVVDTDGEAVGQLNGLSVVDLGDTAFGQPSRITATVGVGREGVIDLQREARLSGPIHSKAVLTLEGFLVDRYAKDTPLSMAARLSFEQNYGGIEGDSATCAETIALLSRLTNLPVNQAYAITGSMDQRGEVQAIGGANHKIEGFYDVCRARGLTGRQGVVIPASNVQHLMLRDDVVQAVKDGKFSIHKVSTIDEALELMTGVPAGELREDGTYPPDSVNGRVQAALKDLAERLRHAGPQPDEKKTPPDEAPA